VAQWEQFEVWRLNGERWELVASFPEFEIANAVARKRSRDVRLIHAVYDGGTLIQKKVLLDLGVPRERP
jgi:hypothetical protein